MEERIKDRIKQELVRVNTTLNPECEKIVRDYKGLFSDVIQENIDVASETGMPLCQDTGVVEFFCFKGADFHLAGPLERILSRAVKEVYAENPFRLSTVSDPLFERKNRMDNSPPMVHIFEKPGNTLEIRYMLKGGGSENLSRLMMMKPTATPDQIKTSVIHHIKEHGAKACPPLKVGIGIGGASEQALILSKLALTEEMETHHQDKRYRELETSIYKGINELEIGFQGLGDGISAYNVRIIDLPVHIATLPVGISVDCYLCRSGRVSFEL